VLVGERGAAINDQGAEKRPPLHLADCDAVRVVSGEVAACFVDKDGDKRCVEVAAGRLVGAALAEASAMHRRSTVDALIAILRGDVRVQRGSSRSAAVAPTVEDTLPRGSVLGASAFIQVTIPPGSRDRIARVTISGDGLPTVAFTDSADGGACVQIPTASLVRGSDYEWRMMTVEGRETVGRFTFAGGEARRDVNRVREIGRDASHSNLSRRAALVALLLRKGYVFESDELIRELLVPTPCSRDERGPS
jgi:hypothetical protein